VKGRRFCEATDLIKNATGELKRLLQNDFQQCFQHLYSRWQKCIVVQGDYFKINVDQMIVLCFSEIKRFREHFEAASYFYW
jgi:hypothetical protein